MASAVFKINFTDLSKMLFYVMEQTSKCSSQYVADNTDYNIRTLEGNDTFHGMGMIAIVILGTKKSNQILRVKVTPKDIAAVGRVPVYYQKEESVVWYECCGFLKTAQLQS